MKYLLSFSLIFTFLFANAQEIDGEWNGILTVQGMQLRLVLHISENNGNYQSTMDSPDQKTFGIPVNSTTYENDKLTFNVQNLGISYEGILKEGNFIEGIFLQNGQSFPLNFKRGQVEKSVPKRPQEPKHPLPYESREVLIHTNNKEVILAGTLTLPDTPGPHPTVILISGSGPQNRDEEFMTHKPFLVLADFLTRHGIAVLRYDDRGYAESTGNHFLATSQDFANDAVAVIRFLENQKEVDADNIGLIGHSEGGLIAPITASKSKKVAFIILMAGPGFRGQDILRLQVKTMGKQSGLSEEEIQRELAFTDGIISRVSNQPDESILQEELSTFLHNIASENTEMLEKNNLTKDQFVNRQLKLLTRPWYRYFIDHNPADYLSKISCPVLAINGEKDVQVDASNLNAIEESLKDAGNPNSMIKLYPGLNHLFQQCETGAISEYAKIETTIEPYVLHDIADWIKKQVIE